MKTVIPKLPKFAEEIKMYDKGEYVRNPFTGEGIELTAEELSVYDYILGLQWIINTQGGPFTQLTAKYQVEMRKGLDWFRKNNAEAYMVLLD
jgi:hypothetical protein